MWFHPVCFFPLIHSSLSEMESGCSIGLVFTSPQYPLVWNSVSLLSCFFLTLTILRNIGEVFWGMKAVETAFIVHFVSWNNKDLPASPYSPVMLWETKVWGVLKEKISKEEVREELKTGRMICEIMTAGQTRRSKWWPSLGWIHRWQGSEFSLSPGSGFPWLQRGCAGNDTGTEKAGVG